MTEGKSTRRWRWVGLAFCSGFVAGFVLGAGLAVILIVQVAISYAP